MKYFETKFLEEADKFIASLDRKIIAKILYNVDLAEKNNDSRLFKNLVMIFGNLELDIMVCK